MRRSIVTTAMTVTTVMVLSAATGVLVSCSNDDGEQDRITRIDGPAVVDDDADPEVVPGEGDGE